MKTTPPTLPAHTPGPWELETKGSKHFIDGADGLTVCVLDRQGVRDNRAENEANAVLIAAAPETAAERDRLREEVRELREALGAIATQAATTSKTFPNAAGRGDWLNVEQIARAVLAKTNPKA